MAQVIGAGHAIVLPISVPHTLLTMLHPPFFPAGMVASAGAQGYCLDVLHDTPKCTAPTERMVVVVWTTHDAAAHNTSAPAWGVDTQVLPCTIA